jgi:hypothetical protein
MHLVSDPSFDDRQQCLVTAILEAVSGELKKVDAPDELISSLTGSIGFAVAALLDDSRSVDFRGGALSPVVTFQLGNDELAFAGGNTWMHEYVYRLLPQVLERIGAGNAPGEL